MKWCNIYNLMTILILLAFIACAESEELSPLNKVKNHVMLNAKIIDDSQTRVFLGDDTGETTDIYWSDDTSDAFSLEVDNNIYIFTKQGVTSNALTADFKCNNAPTLTVGEYVAKYPSENVASYAEQIGTKEALKNYHYMEAAFTISEGEDWDDVNLNFKTKVAIVKLTLSNDAFKEKNVTSLKLMAGRTSVVTATSTYTGSEEGMIEAYFAIPSQSFSMTETSIVATCEGNNYVASLGDKTLAAGKLYQVNKSLTLKQGNIIDPRSTQVGDFAMKDGSFIQKGTTLTDEQKANVIGIVYWTTKAGNTTLTNDKVMNADFPNCTNGLVVSLKDVSTGVTWQATTTDDASVYKFQISANFKDSNKSLYKTIASGTEATHPMNYILGYQNTKLLRAFNVWNTTANKECNLIPKLDAFITNNPAPSNTTGWFLPSAKELLLLCGKEKSNVFANRPLGTSTKTTINNILKSIGATQLGTEADNALYWSTTAAGPKTEYAYYAFEVDFANGNIARKNKCGSNSLRAVYAY